MGRTREACSVSRHDRLAARPWLLGGAAVPSLLLSGCDSLDGGIGAWAYVTLSLTIIACGAYALGRSHGRVGAAAVPGNGSVPKCVPWAAAPLTASDATSDLPPADNVAIHALQQPSAAALEAERQQESDNFSFTVSHDLRAPIRVVEGFTRIVKEDYGALLDRVGNDHLDRVLGATARMNLMIDALLTLARLSQQPLVRQPVDLSQLATYVVEDLQRTAPEREAEVHIESGLRAHGDPTLLRLVLENLLGNAWKYSQRCPRAVISLHRVPMPAAPAGLHRNADATPDPSRQPLAFAVRDNGAGFDMRSSERLFGLFQRLHSASEFPGHGVGLASVRRIVRRHGGEVWAESEAGRGATFFFTLAP